MISTTAAEADQHGPDQTLDVDVDSIIVPTQRLRALQPETVTALAESMRECGQLQPIVLRFQETESGDKLCLVAGRHRLEAAKSLGWKTIRASRYLGEMTADQAELAEIDENLIRADLSPAERKLHIARRKELYEKEHPETKHGGDRVSQRTRASSQNENLISFVEATAKKTGKGRSTIARDVTHANKVKVLAEVAGSCLDSESEIGALAKLSPDEQRRLAAKAKDGEKVSAKPTPPPAKLHDDVGPGSTGECERLRARVEELQAEIYPRELRDHHHLDNGEGLGALLLAWDCASEDVRQRFMLRVGLVRDDPHLPSFLRREAAEGAAS